MCKTKLHIATLLLIVVAPNWSVSQSQTTDKPEKNAASADAPESADEQVEDEATLLKQLEGEIEINIDVMQKTFNGVDIEDEQREKIFAKIEERTPQVVLKSHLQRIVLTGEQRAKYRKQLRLAIRGGFDTKFAHGFAMRSLDIPNETKQKFNEAKAAADFAQNQLNNEIAALLTREQRLKFPMFGGADKFINIRFEMELPKMANDKDANFIRDSLKAIKGVSQMTLKLEEKEIHFNAGYAKKFREAMKELKDKPQFEDFVLYKLVGKPGSGKRVEFKFDFDESKAKDKETKDGETKEQK